MANRKRSTKSRIGTKVRRKDLPPYAKKLYRGISRNNPDWDVDRKARTAISSAMRMGRHGNLSLPGKQRVKSSTRNKSIAAVMQWRGSVASRRAGRIGPSRKPR